MYEQLEVSNQGSTQYGIIIIVIIVIVIIIIIIIIYWYYNSQNTPPSGSTTAKDLRYNDNLHVKDNEDHLLNNVTTNDDFLDFSETLNVQTDHEDIMDDHLSTQYYNQHQNKKKKKTHVYRRNK